MTSFSDTKKILVAESLSGKIVVYDPRCQKEAYKEYALLWHALPKAFICHNIAAAIPRLKSSVPTVRNEALIRYLTFVRQLVQDNHRTRFKAHWLSYPGTIPTCRSARTGIRCFICKNELDISIDIACAGCKWTLCVCGACGCLFRKREPIWSRHKVQYEYETLSRYAWNDASERWEVQSPRYTDPEAICALLEGLPVKVEGAFCQWCDSTVHNEWCLRNNHGTWELRHHAQFPGGVLRPSEHRLLVAALERGEVRGTLVKPRDP